MHCSTRKGDRLAKVHDLRLVELAVRGGSSNWLNDLAKCIEYDGKLTGSEKEKGGCSYATW